MQQIFQCLYYLKHNIFKANLWFSCGGVTIQG